MVLNMFTMSRDANQVDFVGPVMIDEFSISRETSSFSYEMQRENIWFGEVGLKCSLLGINVGKSRGMWLKGGRGECEYDNMMSQIRYEAGGGGVWIRSKKEMSESHVSKKKANVGFERGKVEKNDQEEGGKWS